MGNLYRACLEVGPLHDGCELLGELVDLSHKYANGVSAYQEEMSRLFTQEEYIDIAFPLGSFDSFVEPDTSFQG